MSRLLRINERPERLLPDSFNFAVCGMWPDAGTFDARQQANNRSSFMFPRTRSPDTDDVPVAGYIMKARKVLMRVNTPDKKDFDPKIARSLVAKLGGLAGVRNDRAFEEGLIFAMWLANEASSIERPIPQGVFLNRAEKIGEAAVTLERLLSSSDPVGRRVAEQVMQIASDGNGRCTRIVNCLSAISEAVASLKQSSFVRRGRQPGRAGSASTLDHFVHHLEFAALRAGGNWKLNKNDQRGTLIDAIELLRPHLPEILLPERGKHPYSSYQSVLTFARRDWKEKGPGFDMIIRGLVDAKSGKSLIFSPLDG